MEALLAGAASAAAQSAAGEAAAAALGGALHGAPVRHEVLPMYDAWARVARAMQGAPHENLVVQWEEDTHTLHLRLPGESHTVGCAMVDAIMHLCTDARVAHRVDDGINEAGEEAATLDVQVVLPQASHKEAACAVVAQALAAAADAVRHMGQDLVAHVARHVKETAHQDKPVPESGSTR